MGQRHLGVGTRYERDGQAWVVGQVREDGQAWVVGQVRGDGRRLVEGQSGGGQGVMTREEVTAVWAAGALRFAARIDRRGNVQF